MKLMRKIITLTIVVAAFLLLSTRTAFADDPNIVSVNRVSSRIERLGEKVALFFKFTPKDKLSYDRYLTEKRLAELKFAVDKKEFDGVEELSSRYLTYLQVLEDMTGKYNIAGENAKTVEMAKKHLEVMKSIQSNFPVNSGWWLSTQWSVDTLNGLPTKLKAS